VKELLSMIVGEDDPQIGIKRAQTLAGVSSDFAHAAMTALSSVSGMVKNWGACGSIAPPITVDIMIALLCRNHIAWECATRR